MTTGEIIAAERPEREPADEPIARTPRTIAELPFFAAGRFPKVDVLGQCEAGGVRRIAARDLVDRVRDLSLGLSSIGMTRGDRVAVLAESRPEWLIADFAILTAGAVSTPIYPTLSAEQVAAILRDSGASLAIVSSASQLAKIQAVAGACPALRAIVVIDPMDAPPDPTQTPPVFAWSEIAARGHQRILDGWGVARQFREEADRVRPEDLAAIVYTSGTTGEPKGVMLTHGNLAANLSAIVETLDLSQDDTALSFLPLCHGFERMVAYVYFATGVSMIFAESIDTIARDLLLVRPTVMSGVPRVFEKLRARVLEKGRAPAGWRRAVFNWAVGVAEARGRLPAGARPSAALRAASRIADRVAFSRIRAAIGGRLRLAVSGSAPLNLDVARFFYGLGLPLLEGYGLTETSPAICLMPLGRERFGTVGPPLPHVQLAIADDGEVLVRGPNVMAGYYNRPAETDAVLAGGWFHTGDIGAIDEGGYLRITDRKKELLVTSGGKKIAPQPIEERLRSHALIDEAVLVGDGRHFPAVLIVPDFPALAAHLGEDLDRARARVRDADVRALFEPAIERLNQDLAQFERIKKFTLLARTFSMAAGELTPTLKVKRRVIETKYRKEIEELYGSEVLRF